MTAFCVDSIHSRRGIALECNINVPEDEVKSYIEAMGNTINKVLEKDYVLYEYEVLEENARVINILM